MKLLAPCRRVLRLWPLLLVLTLGARTGHAQEVRAQDVSEPPEYRATIHEALAEYHARNFPEARALFAEAHRLAPNARTLRGLGMTAFELRSYAESMGFLEQALASRVRPLEGGLRLETERLLKRAERFVAKVHVLLVPADAQVWVDGHEVAHQGDEPILLEIGEHRVEFRAEGHLPETRSFPVKGRESETWSIALPPAPKLVAVPPASEVAAQAQANEPRAESDLSPRSSPGERPLHKNPWLWGGVGAAVVVGVVTTIVLSARDPGVGPVREGTNTPTGGVFSGLESRP